ncbi:hypothetical protein B0H17DRAFT_1148455 [Mycena rosella]|uniref:Uncharacterized protein n=1 Tax=Mycena rosella TaxID=1033263 RepID=A0AAD7FVP3_MYCRO|nr:hypothetical protein B0H17DRAFT_1148455 [Mycena rosella]
MTFMVTLTPHRYASIPLRNLLLRLPPCAVVAVEEEEEEPPKKKKKARTKKPATVEEEEEEMPKAKAGKKKPAKEKDAAGNKRKRSDANNGNTTPAKGVPFKHSRVQPQAGRSASIVPSNADLTDKDTAPTQPSSTAAAASTSKSAAKTGWESVRVTDEIRQASKDAADRMRERLAADRKAGLLAPAKPKPQPKSTAKSLQEIEAQGYGSSSDEE